MIRFAMLAILAATAALAQPVVGPETVWRTTSPALTFHAAPQAARIAPDGDGLVVGWSEVDDDGIARAYAGRMDASGRLASIGVRTEGTADGVTIAPFAGRYVAAWMEPEFGDGRPMVIAAALDRDFKLVGAQQLGLTNSPVIIQTTATRAYLAFRDLLYELDAGGAPVATYGLPGVVDDLAIAAGLPVTAHHATSQITRCGFFGCGSFPRFALTAQWLFRLTSKMEVDYFDSDAPAAIAPRGDGFLVVWFEGPWHTVLKGSAFGVQFAPFVISSDVPARLDASTQPQVAWDGRRSLVVWRDAVSIQGAVIQEGVSVMPFTVADRGSRPAIAAVRPDRFVVTYEIVDPERRRLASRIIDFGSARERAVR